MKILISGIVILAIWCFVSAWIYNDKLMAVTKKTITVQTIPETPDPVADSLMKLKASMPKDLLIYFEYDKADFKPDPQTDSRISEFKSWREKYPRSMLLVAGHTDLVGTSDYNNNLGLKRAQIVEKYIEGNGVNTARMVVVSKGKTQPAADYLTPEGRSKNRRTEISIKMQ